MRNQLTSQEPRTENESPADPDGSVRAETAAERFLQHALGTQGDVRFPSALIVSVALLAIVVRARRRQAERRRALDRSDPLDVD